MPGRTMTDDEIFSTAEKAGIQQGIDGAWIALEEELVDFACLIENRVMQEFARKMPDAWMILDKTTMLPVRLSLTDPGDHWLAECYVKVPLYSA